jgi:hypothetical protein
MKEVLFGVLGTFHEFFHPVCVGGREFGVCADIRDNGFHLRRRLYPRCLEEQSLLPWLPLE